MTTANHPAAAAQPGAARRLDLYSPVHKGLRAFMNDTLFRLGRVDPGDEADLREVTEQAGVLLDLLASHLHHENQFIHPALEARQRGSAAATAAEHVEHEEALARLRDQLRALELADTPARPAAAAQLYRELAVFVAENLVHMNEEETVNNAVLWERYTDPELLGIHQAVVAAVPPEKMAVFLRWMVPAASPAERVHLLGGIRQGAPPEVFNRILGIVRPQLRPADWAKLEAALGLAGAAA